MTISSENSPAAPPWRDQLVHFVLATEAAPNATEAAELVAETPEAEAFVTRMLYDLPRFFAAGDPTAELTAGAIDRAEGRLQGLLDGVGDAEIDLIMAASATDSPQGRDESVQENNNVVSLSAHRSRRRLLVMGLTGLAVAAALLIVFQPPPPPTAGPPSLTVAELSPEQAKRFVDHLAPAVGAVGVAGDTLVPFARGYRHALVQRLSTAKLPAATLAAHYAGVTTNEERQKWVDAAAMADDTPCSRESAAEQRECSAGQFGFRLAEVLTGDGDLGSLQGTPEAAQLLDVAMKTLMGPPLETAQQLQGDREAKTVDAAVRARWRTVIDALLGLDATP